MSPALATRLPYAPRRRAARGRGAMAAALLLAGCQGAGGTTPFLAAPSPAAPFWPPGPEPARIRWVAALQGAEDLGYRPGLLARLWDWVSGARPEVLIRPHGVALDPRGRLWVTDPGARRVTIFDFERRRARTLPRRGEAPLVSPIAVAHDPTGRAYVSDSGARTIRRFDPDGHALPAWDAAGELERPTGLAYDAPRGWLWVVDTGGHRILALDAEGRVRRRIGSRGAEPGKFNFPTHLVVDSAGHLLVTDTLNFRVQILEPDGTPLAVLGGVGDGPGALTKPKGVAVDGAGHVYVVDALFDNVQIFDQSGKLLLYFGEPGEGAGQFWLPAGICIVGDRIFVADGYNRRVQVFAYVGGSST